MAGRPPHITDNEHFANFSESIPEDARAQGYWRVRQEKFGKSGGGVIQAILGFLPYEMGETYDDLRERIQKNFAAHRGPGTYYAYACDSKRKEIKSIGVAKFEFTEKEVPMPEPPQDTTAPIRETIATVKKVQKDMADIENIKLQKELFQNLLGKTEKKEEESVKDTSAAGGMNDFFMWKMFMDDSKKKEPPAEPGLSGQSAAVQQQILDAKLQAQMAEVKGLVSQMQQPKSDDRLERMIEKSSEENRRLIEKMAEMQAQAQRDAQAKPPDDRLERLIEKSQDENRRLMEKIVELQAAPKESRTEMLLQKMIEANSNKKEENAIQSMMALMAKEQNDREKLRVEEQKERERLKAEEDRRRYDEQKEREKLKAEDEKRREAQALDERRRVEDERKEERRRSDDAIKLEKQKYESELNEQRRRFDEEVKLRREEMKRDEERSRMSSSESQKFQLELLNIFKNNKDNNLEHMSKVVEAVTSAGLNSMNTAKDAAEAIMDIAKNAGPKEKKEKEGGFMDTVKDVASMAAPFIGPYLSADAQAKALAQAAGMAGMPGAGAAPPPVRRIPRPPQAPPQQRPPQGQRPPQARPMPQRPPGARPQGQPQARPMPKAAARPAGAQPTAERPKPAPARPEQPQPQQAPPSEAGLSGESANEEMVTRMEGSGMIAQYLKAYPIVKKALIGNIRGKKGVKTFLPLVASQPALVSLLACLEPSDVIDEVKQACNEDDKKIIDSDPAWFVALQDEMVKEAQAIVDGGDDDDDGDDDADDGDDGDEEETPASAATPPAQTPAN